MPDAATLVREYMSAFLGSEFERAGGFLAEDVVMNVPGRNALSGRYEGREQAVRFLRDIAARTGGTLRFELVDVVANDRHVVVLFRPSAQQGGKEWAAHAVTVYRVAGGLIEEITVYQHDVYAFDAFMA